MDKKNINKKVKKLNYKELAKMYRVFSSPARLEIVFTLVNGEQSFANLLKILKVKKSNLSQHVTLLKLMNFIETRYEGRNLYCFVRNPKIIKMIKIFRKVLEEKEVRVK